MPAAQMMAEDSRVVPSVKVRVPEEMPQTRVLRRISTPRRARRWRAYSLWSVS